MPILLLIVSAILTLAGFFSQYGWWFDLASHFRVQYCAVQLLCVVLCLFLRKKKILIVTLIFLLLNISQILPLYFPSTTSINKNLEDISKIKILIMNVHTENTEYEKVAQYIDSVNPDILALEEINQRWFEKLSKVLEKFPYKKFVVRGDNFGIGLFSKIPPNNMTVQYYGEVGVPSILANFSMRNKPVDVLFTHPVPPASQNYFHWRNEQLSEIASLRSQFNDNLIVVGDLNTTSWSYYFKNFLAKMKLQDSRQGYGIQTSWPAMMPVLGITIDHCLISSNFYVLNRKIGPDIGSDHYPVYVELGLKH